MGRKPEASIFGTDYPTPDDTSIRDYIHVSDLAPAHVGLIALLAGKVQSQAINLGTARATGSVKSWTLCIASPNCFFVLFEASSREGDPPMLVTVAVARRKSWVGPQKLTLWIRWLVRRGTSIAAVC